MMELWVTGFNAWGQLDFEKVLESHPRDLKVFKCVLKDESIEVMRTTLSATLVRTSTGTRTAGQPDDLIEHCISRQHRLPLLAIAGNDKVVSQHIYENDSQIIDGPNDESQGTVRQWNSFNSYFDDVGVELGLGQMRMIVANQCTFTALSEKGEVWTWGDGRYEACLGRDISVEKPANKPCLVEDLLDLPTGPIRNISSGGYVTAALTEGNDLYVWGGRPGESKLLEDLSEEPTPVDLDGEDVLDVAVGMNHILALTIDRKLFVAGNNSNGQLGLDAMELSDWKHVVLSLKDNQRITSVHTGYKNSIVIVEDIT